LDGCFALSSSLSRNGIVIGSERLRFQPIDATHWPNRSAGVWKFNVSLGLSLNHLATAFSRDSMGTSVVSCSGGTLYRVSALRLACGPMAIRYWMDAACSNAIWRKNNQKSRLITFLLFPTAGTMLANYHLAQSMFFLANSAISLLQKVSFILVMSA